MTNLAALLPRAPHLCFWEITDACNLRCIHCEADAGGRAPDELTTEEALGLADDIAQAGCQTVSLTGGEPLLRRDWPQIARRLADRGIEVLVITNGTFLTEGLIDRMSAAGVTGASVSIDGLKPVHDQIRKIPVGGALDRSPFDLALGAIERLVASTIRCGIITQIHQHNLADLEAMHDLVASLGVDLWQVQLAMPLGRLWRLRGEYLIRPGQLASLNDRLADLIERGQVNIAVADNIGYYGRREPVLRRGLDGEPAFWMGCLAGCRLFAVCSNGDVKGCPSHPRSFVIGNVRETSFAELWADEAGRFDYNRRFSLELLEGRCSGCPFGSICRAGCTTMAFATTGTIYDNPFCLQRADDA